MSPAGEGSRSSAVIVSFFHIDLPVINRCCEVNGFLLLETLLPCVSVFSIETANGGVNNLK